MKRMHTQQGFSLVELMVAMVLGLVLIGGVVHLFSSNKQTYRTANAVSRLQENGRFALETMTYDLRMAGHLGCANQPGFSTNIVATGLSGLAFPASALEALDSDADDQPDTLLIRYASANAAVLDADNPMESEDSDITLLDSVANINSDITAILADCSSADIFVITDVDVDERTISHATHNQDGDEVNDSVNLSKRYRAERGSALMFFVTHAFEVRPTGRTNAAGDPISALYRDDLELIEGVESMQVQFGECLDNGNQRYLSWNEEPDVMVNINSVRVGLLLHSIDRVREQPDETTYSVAGTDILPASDESATGPTHAADRRLRGVFSTTVALRNRPQGDCDV